MLASASQLSSATTLLQHCGTSAVGDVSVGYYFGNCSSERARRKTLEDLLTRQQSYGSQGSMSIQARAVFLATREVSLTRYFPSRWHCAASNGASGLSSLLDGGVRPGSEPVASGQQARPDQFETIRQGRGSDNDAIGSS